jgi:hypothetical protein
MQVTSDDVARASKTMESYSALKKIENNRFKNFDFRLMVDAKTKMVSSEMKYFTRSVPVLDMEWSQNFKQSVPVIAMEWSKMPITISGRIAAQYGGDFVQPLVLHVVVPPTTSMW